MRTILTLLFLTFPFSAVTAQISIRVAPVGGWEVFKNRVEYPELAKKAGLTGVVFAKLWVDSTGAVDSVAVESCYEMDRKAGILGEAVSKAIRATSWSPASYAGKSRNSFVFFPLVFHLKGFPEPVILIEERPALDKGMPGRID